MAEAHNTLLGDIPSWDEPIAMLEACHGRVRAFCDTLQRLAKYLPEHGADIQAQQAAKNILRYFDVAAPKHHADEELDLFPALLTKLGPRDDVEANRLREVIGSLLQEHTVLHGLWQQLRPALLHIAAGEQVELPAVKLFANTYCTHADREEQLVFNFATDTLDAATLSQLSQSMTARRHDTR
ncbi:hemerythrin-like domain-containing protein [Chitinivorax tropicus]|uniref:Hemerythrin-like domain-containing protein n=1 Tax=Chitinivorax tropicus TaxID=714531 RepID=A0A840MPR1_9PROT|nr:hemerythrin domain-containing protein [Chitinivorax tropicus]MBB5020430.1 hemerythrin-like domain-containing protein [Chitinivorax tropicus]